MDRLYLAADRRDGYVDAVHIRKPGGPYDLMDILFFCDLVEAKRENRRRYEAACAAMERERARDD